MFDDVARMDVHLGQAFHLWLRRIHVPKGAVDVHRSGGVACWNPPSRWRLSLTQQLRLLPSMAGIFGIGKVARVVAALQEMAEHHPDDEPHWYLTFLGVEPAQQRSGVGATVLGHGLARVDASGTPAYLEATHPANVPYYERFGFEPLETFHLGDGPPVTAMWRAARTGFRSG